MATVVEFLAAHRERIIEEWRLGVASADSARGLSSPELLNLIPQFFSQLGRASASTAALRLEQQRLIESHLAHRLTQGYELNELLTEIALLGRTIARAIDEQPPHERPSVLDVAALFNELSLTAKAVTRIFTEQLLEDEQREKRYARLIGAIVSGTQKRNDHAVPLSHRLREVLALIMEAMHAQTASLLLLDQRHPNELKAVCSVGIADEALSQYVTSMDSSSFASRVAATGEPYEVVDVAATPIEISDQLRRSGIRSLLGVRLPARHLLRGVLYIGLTEQRAFTPSELRRLGSLGDRLTVHLDNAELVAELRSKVAAIKVFIDAMAHDLRGPIGSAQLASSMLERDPNALSALLPRIRRGLDRADRMITDLLDAHRVEAGDRLPLSKQVVDLVAIARDVADELKEEYPDRVIVHAPDKLIGSFTSTYIRRAIWNLVVNGLKYGDPIAPVVVALTEADGEVAISVHNRGRPIAPVERDRLFQRFTRGLEETALRKSGWGLGLSLVRAATEAHGGTIDVASDEEGTTFTVTLPWLGARGGMGVSDAVAPPA